MAKIIGIVVATTVLCGIVSTMFLMGCNNPYDRELEDEEQRRFLNDLRNKK